MINFYNMHKDEMENKKIWLVKVDDHSCDTEFMAASTEEKAEELMRLALDQNFYGAEPKYFCDAYGRTAEQCVKDHSWDGQEDCVRIIEMELDSSELVS